MHAHSKQMDRLYQYHAKEIIVHEVYTYMYVGWNKHYNFEKHLEEFDEVISEVVNSYELLQPTDEQKPRLKQIHEPNDNLRRPANSGLKLFSQSGVVRYERVPDSDV